MVGPNLWTLLNPSVPYCSDVLKVSVAPELGPYDPESGTLFVILFHGSTNKVFGKILL